MIVYATWSLQDRQESDSKFRLRVNRFDESVYYDIVLMNEDHLVNNCLDVGEDRERGRRAGATNAIFHHFLKRVCRGRDAALRSGARSGMGARLGTPFPASA